MEASERKISINKLLKERLTDESSHNQYSYQEYEQARRSSVLQDIDKVLYIDQRVMNFYTFMPGKILGSNLIVYNKTDCDQIIDISIDSQSYVFNKEALLEQFPDTIMDSTVDQSKQMIPFTLRKLKSDKNYKKNITNSEMQYKCWKIENPVSK